MLGPLIVGVLLVTEVDNKCVAYQVCVYYVTTERKLKTVVIVSDKSPTAGTRTAA